MEDNWATGTCQTFKNHDTCATTNVGHSSLNVLTFSPEKTRAWNASETGSDVRYTTKILRKFLNYTTGTMYTI